MYRLTGDAAEGEADDGEVLPSPPPIAALPSQGGGGGGGGGAGDGGGGGGGGGWGGGWGGGEGASPGAVAGGRVRHLEPTQVAAAGDEARLDATQPADCGSDHGDCGSDHGDASSGGADGGVLALARVGGDLGLLVGGFRWGLALWQLGSRQLLSWFAAEA